jgi:transposase
MNANKGKCIIINDILDFMQNDYTYQNIEKLSYYDIRRSLKYDMNYTWKKSGQRGPNSLRNNITSDRLIFKTFIDKLKMAEYLIIYIDECTFSSAALPLYSWMPRGINAENVIRPTNARFNCISEQWNSNIYFVVKQETTNENSFLKFIIDLHLELKKRVSANYYAKRTIYLMDNAKIHKTKAIQQKLKELKIVAFTLPPYSPELNMIEHTFGGIKKRLARRNLSVKEFKNSLTKEISIYS